jgi:hypothetical protein
MGNAILRFVLGVIAGTVVMYVAISLVELLGQQVWPPPPGLDPHDVHDMATIIATAPIGALACMVLAWAVGAFTGGAVAAWISRYWPRAAAIVVACCVLLGVIGMILMMPGHPMWMAALGIVLPVPSALLGAWFARPRRALPPP